MSAWEQGMMIGQAHKNRQDQAASDQNAAEWKSLAIKATQNFQGEQAKSAQLERKVQSVQSDFQTWKDRKGEYPVSTFSQDIQCAVKPEDFATADLPVRRDINLKLCAWAEYWMCLEQNGKYTKRNDSKAAMTLSRALANPDIVTKAQIRDASSAMADIANRLSLAYDDAMEDPHAWVNARVKDMWTTAKFKDGDDRAIPYPESLDGQKGKPQTIRDIEQKYRDEGKKGFIADMIGLNIMGAGDMALR